MARRGQIDKPEFRREGTHEQTAVRGKRERMNTAPLGGNLTLLPTQLIRANVPTPRQWLVTLFPPTKGDGVVPYASTFDAGVFPAVAPQIYTAPLLPDVPAALQVHVMWGAGGVRNETMFDYPAVGGTFSITADSMDISAAVKGAQSIVYSTQNDIPVIGAFYVEGAPVDDTPMAWMEEGLSILAAADASWAVKPFAKQLILCIEQLVTSVRIEWLNTRNITIQQLTLAPVAGSDQYLRLDVPRQATVIRITNLGAAAGSVFLEWGIGLS